MSQINIVEDTTSVYGLRTLHALDFFGPIDVEQMRALVPMECREYAGIHPVFDPEMRAYHMFAVWEVREMTDVRGLGKDVPLRYGMLWRVLKGERLGVSYYLAADKYHACTERWPTHGWARKLPASSPRTLDLQQGVMELADAEWMPESFICVGIPTSVWNPVWKDGQYL